ncbi:MAG: hemerythrin domain-containing protein [Elusimicrobia bacterium]|nr:hemerythrin domain-containing protein [Candidatus Liberimonas magnetica]
MDQEDTSKIKAIFEVLKRFKSSFLEFCQASADVWVEDKGFWLSLAEEVQRHINDVDKMAVKVQERPGDFEIGEPFRFDVVDMFLSDIKKNIKLLKNKELSKKETLVIARNIEQSVLGTKYSEIVKTNDQEYLELAKEVISQTVLLKGRLNKRISDLDRGLWEIKPQEVIKKTVIPDIPKPASIDDKGPTKASESFLKVNSYHNLYKEYLVLMQKIETELQKHSIWMHLEKIEKFMKRDISEHFNFEDEVIFKQILSENTDDTMRQLIDELENDHKMLIDKISQFEQIVYGVVFPLSKKKTEELSILIQEFTIISLNHLNKEEDKILPLVK